MVCKEPDNALGLNTGSTASDPSQSRVSELTLARVKCFCGFLHHSLSPFAHIAPLYDWTQEIKPST